MSELKNCPFCGGESRVDKTGYGEFSIYCPNVDCAVGSSITCRAKHSDRAISDWNTRAADAALAEKDAEIGELDRSWRRNMVLLQEIMQGDYSRRTGSEPEDIQFEVDLAVNLRAEVKRLTETVETQSGAMRVAITENAALERRVAELEEKAKDARAMLSHGEDCSAYKQRPCDCGWTGLGDVLTTLGAE